jgi:hypothetical protein
MLTTVALLLLGQMTRQCACPTLEVSDLATEITNSLERRGAVAAAQPRGATQCAVGPEHAINFGGGSAHVRAAICAPEGGTIAPGTRVTLELVDESQNTTGLVTDELGVALVPEWKPIRPPPKATETTPAVQAWPLSLAEGCVVGVAVVLVVLLTELLWRRHRRTKELVATGERLLRDDARAAFLKSEAAKEAAIRAGWGR